MLRTNSKKVMEKIRALILDSFIKPSDAGYYIPDPTNYTETVSAIYNAFIEEKYFDDTCKRYFRYSEEAAFISWLQGLPSLFDPAYYYRLQAVDVLGDILEETETERNRYTEAEAENLLSRLIYREIKKGAAK